MYIPAAPETSPEISVVKWCSSDIAQALVCGMEHSIGLKPQRQLMTSISPDFMTLSVQSKIQG
jgi:hypothetical protein